MKIMNIVRGLVKAAKNQARRLSLLGYEDSTATTPVHDDLYVVSFPKSGATWMNFLMANIHILASDSKRHVTFFNVTDFIPDVQANKNIKAEPPLSFPGFRVMKSHAQYNPNYKKVIYIVRDPRDAMASYYVFARQLGLYVGEISTFIRDEHFGVNAWVDHVKGWFLDSPIATRVLPVRYEDLKGSCVETMKSVYFQFGYKLDDDLLKAAAELSSFANMKSIEKTFNHGGRDRFSEFEFMRKGESGNWQKALSPEDIRYIEQQARPWLEHFNY